MRILLDECLDWRLKRELTGHDVFSVGDMGWSGIKNGKLLAMAESQFQVFITGDRNLSFEQNLPNLNLAIIVLEAPSIRLADTALLMPKVLALLPTISAGQLYRVGLINS